MDYSEKLFKELNINTSPIENYKLIWSYFKCRLDDLSHQFQADVIYFEIYTELVYL